MTSNSSSSSTNTKLEINTEDKSPNKWSVALSEEVFRRFLTKGGAVEHKVFGDGSLFSPFLFGKYFDPSDAFPLWEFESEILLSGLRSSGQCTVDWSQTDQAYALKAELPGNGKNGVKAYLENGKVMEISGKWNQQRDQTQTKDWRSGRWWEQGYVRRLELPEDGDPKKIEGCVYNDVVLEIKIPKTNSPHDSQSNVTGGKSSDS